MRICTGFYSHSRHQVGYNGSVHGHTHRHIHQRASAANPHQPATGGYNMEHWAHQWPSHGNHLSHSQWHSAGDFRITQMFWQITCDSFYSATSTVAAGRWLAGWPVGLVKGSFDVGGIGVGSTKATARTALSRRHHVTCQSLLSHTCCYTHVLNRTNVHGLESSWTAVGLVTLPELYQYKQSRV